MVPYFGDVQETLILILALLEGLEPERREASVRRLLILPLPDDAGIRDLLRDAVVAHLPPSDYPDWVRDNRLQTLPERAEDPTWHTIVEELEARYPGWRDVAEEAAIAAEGHAAVEEAVSLLRQQHDATLAVAAPAPAARRPRPARSPRRAALAGVGVAIMIALAALGGMAGDVSPAGDLLRIETVPAPAPGGSNEQHPSTIVAAATPVLCPVSDARAELQPCSPETRAGEFVLG